MEQGLEQGLEAIMKASYHMKQVCENGAQCVIFIRKAIGVGAIFGMWIFAVPISNQVKAQSIDKLPPPPVPKISSMSVVAFRRALDLEQPRRFGTTISHDTPSWTSENYYWYDDEGSIEDADTRRPNAIFHSNYSGEGFTLFAIVVRTGDPSRYSGISWAIISWTVIYQPKRYSFHIPFQHAWVFDSEGNHYQISATARGTF